MEVSLTGHADSVLRGLSRQRRLSPSAGDSAGDSDAHAEDEEDAHAEEEEEDAHAEDEEDDLSALCDCCLVLDGVPHRAHRAVLAACSRYFRRLFAQQPHVDKIDVKNSPGVSLLLESMYSSRLVLSPETAVHVESAARFLEMPGALDACRRFSLLLGGG
uniref:Zinc finger and BTB domain-containing protein 17-like n=1 Tax=Petromyzon marinus TaxID=7757 RepID=A0AAJ7WJH5_PETMA|nr:zinc finger and BTB domain-containing protein 17-like [Petromyzon marinus]